jgi:hypothetical protein
MKFGQTLTAVQGVLDESMVQCALAKSFQFFTGRTPAPILIQISSFHQRAKAT